MREQRKCKRQKLDKANACIEQVHSLIEQCLQIHMSKAQVIQFLVTQHHIDPKLATVVFQRLENQNQEFFNEYHKKVKLLPQIEAFNSLINQQAAANTRFTSDLQSYGYQVPFSQAHCAAYSSVAATSSAFESPRAPYEPDEPCQPDELRGQSLESGDAPLRGMPRILSLSDINKGNFPRNLSLSNLDFSGSDDLLDLDFLVSDGYDTADEDASAR